MKKIPRGIIYHKPAQSLYYLARALFSPLNEGEKIREWEGKFAAYCGRKHCAAFPFARTALYFVLKGLNLPSGSEILMPPITIKGILDVVVDLGLVPVYVDSDPQTICFQMEELRAKITPRTKVALITTLFGLVPDLASMTRLLKDHGIFVIEDFSQCLNGRLNGKRVGTFGDVAIYSSSSIKTLDTLGGGMALTNDEKLAEDLKKAQDGLLPPDRLFLVKKAWTNMVRNLATRQPFFSLLTFPFLQLVRRLNPETALKQTGHRQKNRLARLPQLWFRRYTSLQARIGLEHMEEVSAGDEARIANVDSVKAGCPRAGFPQTTPSSRNVYWQLILPVPDALKAQVFLAKQGIDSATSSLELVCALQDYPNRADLPMASQLYRNGLFIPCFPNLSAQDMQRIVAALRQFLEGPPDAR